MRSQPILRDIETAESGHQNMSRQWTKTKDTLET